MAENKKEKNNSIILKTMKYGHLLLMVACFSFVWLKWYQPRFHSYNARLLNIAAICTYAVLYYLFVRIYHGYEILIRKNNVIKLALFLSAFLSMLLMYLINVVAWWRYFHFRNPLPMLAAVALQQIINIIWTDICSKWYGSVFKAKKSIVLYSKKQDLNRLADLANFEKQFSVEETVCLSAEGKAAVFEKIKSYEAVFVSGIESQLRDDIVKYCLANGMAIFVVPSVGDILVSGGVHARQFSTAVLNIRGIKRTSEYFFIKRFFDVLLSGLAIIVLSPLLLIIALCVKLEDGGPAIYKQIRLTRGGKKFYVLKFRSMRVDAEKDGVARLASENDDRITRVGAFLRKCRLDELPQLFNIFVGDMSIVGPRPERPEIAKQYKEIIPSFDLRLQVKAGLTGYAQVFGRYNTDPYDKLEMDLIYINNMNIFMDIELIFATVATMFSKEAASGVNSTMM